MSKGKGKKTRSAARAVPLVAGLIGALGVADDARAQLAPAPGQPVTDDKVRTDTGAPTGQPTVQQALEYHPPAAPSMKDVDTAKVPSPYVAPANHEAYLALEKKMTGDISRALDTMELSGDQRIMVRNYMGQFDKDTKVVATGVVNGAQTFGIQDRKTGEYVGSVELRPTDNGAVQVSKVYAAQFEGKKQVELAVPTSMVPEQAKQALGESEETYSLARDAADGKLEVAIPQIKAKAGLDYGLAKESTAVFNPDGSGKEFVFTTKIGSASAEAKANLEGVAGGVGVKGPQAEVQVTYFGKSAVNDQGELTHSETGAKVEVHGTLANAEGHVGCVEENCGAGASIGVLGAGGGAELVFSPAKKVAFDENVAEEHQASPAEQAAFKQATASGTPEALEKFISDYPDSAHIDEVVNLMDLGAAQTPPDPEPETGKGKPGHKGY